MRADRRRRFEHRVPERDLGEVRRGEQELLRRRERVETHEVERDVAAHRARVCVSTV